MRSGSPREQRLLGVVCEHRGTRVKFSELNERGRDVAIRGIESHTETLRALLIASGDRAEHHLLWTNGGAVIALLSFMAASERIRELPAAWHALMCFAVGIAACFAR